MELFNLALYTGLLLWLFKYRQKAAIALYVTAIWVFSAFVGLFYVDSANYRSGLTDITIIPFIYLFLCFVLLIKNFFEQKEDVVSIVCNYEQNLTTFISLICLLAIEPMAELVYQLFDLFISGRFLLLGASYESVVDGEKDALVTLSKFGGFSIELLRGFKILGPILIFYYLQKERFSILLIAGILSMSLLRPIQSITNGNRTELVWFVIYFLSLIILLRKTISKKGKIFIRKILVYGGSLVLIIFLALTIGRYVVGKGGTNDDASNALMQYTAEPMYSFNNSMFYENGDLGGVATALPLMQAFGVTDVTKENQNDYVGRHMMGNSIIFYTIVGDFFNDYGMVATPIIFLLLSFLFGKIKLVRCMQLHDLVLLSTFIYIVVNGLFYFCMKLYYTPIYVNFAFYIICSLFTKKKSY